MASSRRAAVRSVPDTGSRRPIGSNCTPSERGKNSYQAPYRARSLSTSTGIRTDLVIRSRSGNLLKMILICGVSVAASRSQGGSPRSLSFLASVLSKARAAAGPAAPGGCLIPRAARSKSSAPSASISSTSWPRGTLMAASWCQCAIGSLQASTWNCQVPSCVTVTSAPYLSDPGASSRMITSGPGLPAGSRSTTPAPRAPWPSRMTVALTWKVSPSTALAGRRPQSTTGSMRRMGIRPITRSPYPLAIHKRAPPLRN